MPGRQAVELTLPIKAEFLPVATACVEQTAQAYGMGRVETMHLMLAVEEVLSFLAARLSGAHHLMKLHCRNGRYYMEVVCRFPSNVLPVGAFNITSTVSADDEQSLAEMGLLLAARTADHLGVSAKNGDMEIRFVKNRQYPALPTNPAPVAMQGTLRIAEPVPELIKQFAARVAGKYERQAPEYFQAPGKVADMAASGDYGVSLVVDGKNNIMAGIFWRNGKQMAEAAGPYVFCDEADAAIQAVEGCLQKLARTSVLCLVVQQPTPDMPAGYFEPLAQDGSVLYRQLGEDNGTLVYTHPIFADYLTNGYRNLFLPRDVRRVENQGEKQSPHSAFAVRMDRPAGRVVMESIWAGADAPAVVGQHIQALRQEEFREIYFHLDTGVPEQALLSPALSANGFKPAWIVPWGGEGDILVLAYQEEASC